MNSLNQRLTAVSHFIKGALLADIGSDHAYLPIYALENNLCQKAIAGEVVKGPYNAARDNVLKYGMEDAIEVKLGDGLDVIDSENTVDTITICGMGGPLIAEILERGKDKLNNHPRLILQSNIQTVNVRKTLQSLNYHIIDETIMEEKGHLYEIVVAEFGKTTMSEASLKFGPILMQDKNELFIQKWKRELDALIKIKSHLNKEKHTTRIFEIENEINMIHEVLK